MFSVAPRFSFNKLSCAHDMIREALSSSIAEAIQTLPGFLGYQGGVDRNTSTIVAISNWEDRGSAEFPRDKLGDVFDRVTALVQLEPAEIYETTITA